MFSTLLWAKLREAEKVFSEQGRKYLEEHKRTSGFFLFFFYFFFFWKGVGERLAKEKINLLRMTCKSSSFQNQVISHPHSSHPCKK